MDPGECQQHSGYRDQAGHRRGGVDPGGVIGQEQVSLRTVGDKRPDRFSNEPPVRPVRSVELAAGDEWKDAHAVAVVQGARPVGFGYAVDGDQLHPADDAQVVQQVADGGAAGQLDGRLPLCLTGQVLAKTGIEFDVQLHDRPVFDRLQDCQSFPGLAVLAVTLQWMHYTRNWRGGQAVLGGGLTTANLEKERMGANLTWVFGKGLT